MKSKSHGSAADEIRLLGMDLEEDSFCWKVVHPGDRLFWIRVEKEAPSNWVYVSDLKLSNQDAQLAAEALAAVLRIRRTPHRVALRLLDVAPANPDADTEELLGTWVSFFKHLALVSQRLLGHVGIEERHGKKDVTARFN